MDEYSDMVSVAKPLVYITVGELVHTHRVSVHVGLGCATHGQLQWPRGKAQPCLCSPPSQLLLEHQDGLAPDHRDPLHELLEDLGEPPTVADLVGIVSRAPQGRATGLGGGASPCPHAVLSRSGLGRDTGPRQMGTEWTEICGSLARGAGTEVQRVKGLLEVFGLVW